MATENLISGETKIRETKTRIKENPISIDNATTAEERATGQLLVG